MSDQERQNLERILAKARMHLAEIKKRATIKNAIEIANREAQLESYFEKYKQESPE